jgi:hypothetical protein
VYRLWQAAIELGRQTDEFLRELRNIASETQSVRPGILRMQPSPATLREIDQRLRGVGIVLPVYVIAEINRWLVTDKTQSTTDANGVASFPVTNALRTYATQMTTGVNLTPATQAAIGMLMFDSAFRFDFMNGNPPPALADQGFAITAEEEEAIRKAFTPTAENAAASFFNASWPGGSCLTRFRVYDQYVHSNF